MSLKKIGWELPFRLSPSGFACQLDIYLTGIPSLIKSDSEGTLVNNKFQFQFLSCVMHFSNITASVM